MKPDWIRADPKSMTGVLIRRGKIRDTPGGGQVKTEGETGGMRPQPRDTWGHRKLQRQRSSSPELSEELTLPASGSGTSASRIVRACLLFSAPRFLVLGYSNPRTLKHPHTHIQLYASPLLPTLKCISETVPLNTAMTTAPLKPQAIPLTSCCLRPAPSHLV